MKNFNIAPIDKEIEQKIQGEIDKKTKPIGALGELENIALKVGAIQNTLVPQLNNPTIVVFAGDHGIAEDGEVNPFSQEVTWQMVYNFLGEGAAINVFANQNNINIKIVDAGVKHDFEAHPKLIDAKIAYGTKNYLHEPAMNAEDCIKAINKGAEIVQSIYNEGSKYYWLWGNGNWKYFCCSIINECFYGVTN